MLRALGLRLDGLGFQGSFRGSVSGLPARYKASMKVQGLFPG